MGIYLWDAPGVETPLMMEWLAHVLQPELFKELDVRADAKNSMRILCTTIFQKQIWRKFLLMKLIKTARRCFDANGSK